MSQNQLQPVRLSRKFEYRDYTCFVEEMSDGGFWSHLDGGGAEYWSVPTIDEAIEIVKRQVDNSEAGHPTDVVSFAKKWATDQEYSELLEDLRWVMVTDKIRFCNQILSGQINVPVYRDSLKKSFIRLRRVSNERHSSSRR